MVETEKVPNNSNTRRLIFLSAIIIGFVCGVCSLGKLLKDNGIDNIPLLVSSFLFPRKANIESDGGRINLLILGKAGEGYSAPDLTDTIIVASLSEGEDFIRLISIPRDIWIPSIRAKINSAYYWGHQSDENDGTELARSLVSEIVGQPIHYAVVVDFSGFREIIDVLGGIDVVVDRGFVDEKYPIAGKENDECDGDKKYLCRFEVVSFQEGKIHMDGETALKFVRSRNAEGEEGTDLAREIRQQKVVSGIEQKALSAATLTSPKKMLNLWQVVREYIKTDMSGPAISVVVRRIISARKNTSSFVFPDELLVNPPADKRYDFQYVFVPEKGNWGEVHIWVNSLLQ